MKINSLEVKPITNDDLIGISELLNNNFDPLGKDVWLSRFDHWFQVNPAFDSEIDLIGYCIKSGDKVLGSIFTIPSLMKINGKKFKVINLSTWYVDKDARKKSMDLLYLASSLNYSLIFSTTVKQNFIPHTLKFGFKPYIKSDKVFSKVAPLFLLKLFSKTSIISKFQKRHNINIIEKLDDRQNELDSLFFNTGLTNCRSYSSYHWILSSKLKSISYFGIELDNKLIGCFLFKSLMKKISILECIDFVILDKYNNAKDISYFFNKLLIFIKAKEIIISIPQTCSETLYDALTFPFIRITRENFNNKLIKIKNNLITLDSNYYLTNQGDMNL